MTDGQPHPLARAVRPLPRRPDDRARHDDRERRAAVDPGGPRLHGDLARLGRERLPAHLRRLPAARRPARRPLRPPAAVPDRASRSSRSPRSPAASSTSQGLLVAARAVQGLGGAVVSAVALSLIMTLFTEPAERAKAMGVFGFVAVRRRHDRRARSAACSPTRSTGTGSSSSTSRSASPSCALSLRLLPAARGAGRDGRLDVAGAIT